MTRRQGCALLSATTAVIAAICAAVYVGTASGDSSGGDRNPFVVGTPSPRHSAAPASAGTWVGAWSASPSGAEPGTEGQAMAGRSVRNVVHAGVSGTSARITLSNLYGNRPLTLTHASIALSATSQDATAAPGTMRRLSFDGALTVVIPPGEQVVSDTVRIALPQDSDVLVTTYAPTASGPVTYHRHARQISYLAQGDRTEDTSNAAYTEQTRSWHYLTALDVLSDEAIGTAVVLGDSITDGITSTAGADHRWTDILSDRLRTAAGTPGVPRYSVANQGISGNRVLAGGTTGRPADNPSALSRFDRDVLGRTNIKALVIDLGINDILRAPGRPDPDRITAGLRTLVSEAHAHGLKVVGATLMPFKDHRGYSTDREQARQAVNAQIRAGTVYDDVVDFDQALRDPYDPSRLRPAYDSGDHLHPGDRGFQRMAEVFDLGSLNGAAPARL